MDRSRFEELVKEGIDLIPQEFLDKIENVAIVVEDEPTPSQRKKLNLRSDVHLFGLYEGVNLLSRSNYTAVAPDKITIFRNAILYAARSEEGVRKIIKDTVWHEIAHHFGMNEKEVRNAEQKRVKR